MQIKAWEKVGEPRVVVKKYGKAFVLQDFRNPAGLIEEFSLFGQQDWSIVLAVTNDDLVVATEQYKQGCDQIVTELPAGTTNFKDEPAEEVMRRELLEETGYEPCKVVNLGPPLFIATRNSWTRYHPFLALGCLKVKKAKRDASEEIVTKLVPLDRWIQFCLYEDVNDANVVTTFRAMPHFGYRFERFGY